MKFWAACCVLGAPSLVLADTPPPEPSSPDEQSDVSATVQTVVEPAPVTPLAPGARHADAKSRGMARFLSIGGTVAGWGMVAVSIGTESLPLFLVGQGVTAVGPSAAHLFYTDEVAHGLIFSGIRAGALIAADVGAALVIGCALGNAFSGEADEDCSTGATALLLGGLGVAVALGVYDWVDSARSADRYNQRKGFTLSVAPISLLGRDRDRGHGLALVGTF